MSAFLINVDDCPDISKRPAEGGHVPGVGNVKPLEEASGSVKFLGREEAGPWVFYEVRPAGDKIPLHKHKANRTEFLFEGEIEWIEPGKEPKVYGAGTLSYVPAGTVYGYNVLKSATILISFEGPPGVSWI